MIKFEGIRPTSGEISLLKFSNDRGAFVEIPIEHSIAKMISMYLFMISEDLNKEEVERAAQEEDPV